MSDEELAGRFFDEYIAAIVDRVEVSPEGMDLMRRRYVEGAVPNLAVLRHIRWTYRESARD